MNKKINPTGLKGKKEVTNRMFELMGLNESEVKETPVHSIKLTKKGPDGKAYGIVKENNKYFIKTANINEEGLVVEAFDYIGGLENKIKESYSSYSKATKVLQSKFIELARMTNTVTETNLLTNDNLLSESYTGVAMSGISEMEEECIDESEELYEIEDLSETEELDEADFGDGNFVKSKTEEIEESMKQIDELYESVMGKKKILK